MPYVWDMYYELKIDFESTRWTQDGDRVGVCEEAAKDAIEDFENYGWFCNANGKCMFKWQTLYNNLKNGRYRPDSREHARQLFRVIMRGRGWTLPHDF